MTTNYRRAKTSYRYIVVGLGGLGSAAAYWLSQTEGSEVLGIEQFELGHGRGESDDHSRIIRKTYHTPAYVRLAEAAYETWDIVEKDAGEELVVKTGELNFWPEETSLNKCDYTDALTACGVPFEMFSAAEVHRNFPQFVLDDNVHAIWQRDGGLLASRKANGAHRRLATRNGAMLMDNAPTSAIRQINGGYEVEAGGLVFEAEKLVIAAGPWTNKILAHFGMQLPLAVTHEQVSYFKPLSADAFVPEQFPVWIWMILDNYYGFPIYGESGIKVAKDRFFRVDPDKRDFVADEANERQVRNFLSQHIPLAAGPLIYTKTCLLTHTPDTDFVLDSLPGHPNVHCVVGANHAMKFASLIGKILRDLSVSGITSNDISPFSFSRTGLHPDSRFQF